MPDYPGVDPDGLTPGGLQVAGRVNAAELAISGALVAPAVIGAGAWNCNAGASVTDGNNAALPFDAEAAPLASIGYTAGSVDLTILESGIYLCMASAFSNVGWSAGFLSMGITSTGSSPFPQNTSVLGHEGSGNGQIIASCLSYFPAGETIEIIVYNHTGVTDTFFGNMAIVRLA